MQNYKIIKYKGEKVCVQKIYDLTYFLVFCYKNRLLRKNNYMCGASLPVTAAAHVMNQEYETMRQ